MTKSLSPWPDLVAVHRYSKHHFLCDAAQIVSGFEEQNIS